MSHVGRVSEVFRCIRQFLDWPAIIPAYIGLRSLSWPFAPRTRSGLSFALEEFYDLETLWQIHCREVYDVRPDDRVIVDVGANIGLFACYAAQLAPHGMVHAVEPFPRTFKRLVQTVDRNQLSHRIVCHEIAISASSGVGTMTGSGSPSQMYHLIDSRGVTAGDVVTVPTTTLEALFAAIAAPVIDVLKIDIEGQEYEVLLNTPLDCLRRVRRVNVEFHQVSSDRGDKRALVRHLLKAGFRLREDPAAAAPYGIFHFVR